MSKKPQGERNLITNRRAGYDYFLDDHFEAGIELTGSEVKSLRAGRANLQEAYVKVDRGEAFLVGCHISPYAEANRFNHVPTRDRRLLLHKAQILKLVRATGQQGMTIVPIRLYLQGSWVKVEIATGKGKKHYDKREALKEKAVRADLRR